MTKFEFTESEVALIWNMTNQTPVKGEVAELLVELRAKIRPEIKKIGEARAKKPPAPKNAEEKKAEPKEE